MNYACTKVPHRSPAAARKWARKRGYGGDAKHIYECKLCEGKVYHYTRLKPQPDVRPKGDLRLQYLADFAKIVT